MYREMKDSGVEWIGEIPKDWDLKNIKSVLAERNESNNPMKTDFILSLTKERGVIPYSEKGDMGNKSKEDYTGYKLAYPKDIVLNSMNIIIGSVGISDYFGAVSPVYYMLYPRNEGECVEYFNYIFQTKEFQNNLRGYGNGIMELRMRIQMSKLNTILIPYTSIKEQVEIANYLDKKVSQIDTIISKQKRLIEKYKAYKQSLITETVTKGLDKNVPMKDSGIEHIGSLPNNWKVIKIKYLLEERNDKSVTGEGEPLSMSQKYGLIKTKDMEIIPNMTSSYIGNKSVLCGDLVFNKLKAHLGVFAFSRYEGLVSPDYAVYYSKGNSNVKFLEFLFKTQSYINEFKKYSKGVGQGLTRLYTNDLFNIKCALPKIQEQNIIVEYIENKFNTIDSAISKKEQLIEKLESYKKSLIYECVTGKRDVRVVEKELSYV